jgi:trehalose 6-phosphate synthase
MNPIVTGVVRRLTEKMVDVEERLTDARPLDKVRPQALRSEIPPPQIIVLANREPYRHDYDNSGRLRVTRSSSGVVNAVEPLLLEHSGVWVAEGVGFADREAAWDRDGLDVPADDARYRLRRVWLEPEERDGYYCGFSNSGLWPLCHRTAVEPTFFASDFQTYETVNRRFAAAVAEEALEAAPVVLVQDYHFALAPQLIRRHLPASRIAMFWHIPWPRPETFAMCPWGRALVDGLLGSSVIGFQTAADRSQFLTTVEQLLQLRVDRYTNTVQYQHRSISLRVFPASIEWPGIWSDAAPVSVCRQTVRDELGLDRDVMLGVGVDRLDYTKGLEQKILAIERLLERRPQLVGRFAFVQVAEPSRDCLSAYQQTRSQVVNAAERVNRRFAGAGALPIILRESHHPPSALARFFRAADFCYVGSLHDGMNLVSKEFVSARDDERGVLVLSAFAGASQELTDAVIVNPYDIECTATKIGNALDMPVGQQCERMRRLRRVVAAADARRWANQLLSAALEVDHEVAAISAIESDSLRTLVSSLRRPASGVSAS